MRTKYLTVLFIALRILAIFFISNNIFAKTLILPKEIIYEKGQGELPIDPELSRFFNVTFSTTAHDCEGKHSYKFGSMFIYRGAVDHLFVSVYKYETPGAVCFIDLTSKSDQYKYTRKGWEIPWVDPHPNIQVWCLSRNPEDCDVVVPG